MSESLGLSQSPRPHQNSDVKSGRNTLTGSSCGREPESHAQLIGRQRVVVRGPGQPEGRQVAAAAYRTGLVMILRRKLPL